MPALGDNYMYLVQPSGKAAAILVDPVDHRLASHQVIKQKTRLESILCTHHHADHDSGNSPLKRIYPEVEIYATDERVSGHTKIIESLNERLISGLKILTLHTPCHTMGHGIFVVKSDSGPNAVFVGDTLFHAGCGRFFEGDANHMVSSLELIKNNVDENDLMYFGHEYSGSNLRFAQYVDPDNQDIKSRILEVSDLRSEENSTTPTSFGLEYKVNPFLRLNNHSIISTVGGNSPVEICANLREMKDNF